MMAHKGKCPKCHYADASFIMPEVSLPYVNLIKDRELLYDLAITNIKDLIEEFAEAKLAELMTGEGKLLKTSIFVDHNALTYTQLATNFLEERTEELGDELFSS